MDFIPDLDLIGLPESRYEGRLSGKGTLGKKTYISQGDDLFNKAHYTVLGNSIVVEPYIEEHMDFVRSENPGKNETWVTRHHMETFGDWCEKNARVIKILEMNFICWLGNQRGMSSRTKEMEIHFTPYHKIKRVPTKTVVSVWIPRTRMGTCTHIMVV